MTVAGDGIAGEGLAVQGAIIGFGGAGTTTGAATRNSPLALVAALIGAYVGHRVGAEVRTQIATRRYQLHRNGQWIVTRAAGPHAAADAPAGPERGLLPRAGAGRPPLRSITPKYGNPATLDDTGSRKRPPLGPRRARATARPRCVVSERVPEQCAMSPR